MVCYTYQYFTGSLGGASTASVSVHSDYWGGLTAISSVHKVTQSCATSAHWTIRETVLMHCWKEMASRSSWRLAVASPNLARSRCKLVTQSQYLHLPPLYRAFSRTPPRILPTLGSCFTAWNHWLPKSRILFLSSGQAGSSHCKFLQPVACI